MIENCSGAPVIPSKSTTTIQSRDYIIQAVTVRAIVTVKIRSKTRRKKMINTSYIDEGEDEHQEKKNSNPAKPVAAKQLRGVPSATSIRSVDDIVKESPITSDTECGLLCFRGKFLQKFANKKAYVFLYGFLGCIFSASAAYYNGTITTMEKRFRIPSKTIGLIVIGGHVSQLLVSGVLSYYASKGHRPRWIAVGVYIMALYCCIAMLPHFLFGPGDNALQLTKEYDRIISYTSKLSIPAVQDKERKFLCLSKDTSENHCEKSDGTYAPQIILFTAKFVAGIGGSLFFTLGISYMDDNIQKSKTPALVSITYFIRMLGPAIGYALASFALKFYISPSMTPTITTQDPRWLGAWWMGWIIFAILLFIFASTIALFPRTLPRAAARRILAFERNKSKINGIEKVGQENEENNLETKASWNDMMTTFKRLVTNKALMCNNLASIFFCFGYTPYWMFMPKYIEIEYKQSASASSLMTGTVGLVFSAFGLLLAGLVISKYKPRARYLAGWNVIVSIIVMLGMLAFAYFGCSANDKQVTEMKADGILRTKFDCNENCNCDYVMYNPVCANDGKTYLSACHAGCRNWTINSFGSKVYTDCNCVTNEQSIATLNLPKEITSDAGTAMPGACKVDCMNNLYIFLAIVCVLKFTGAAGRATNFLVSVRCVAEQDKAVAMGFGMMIMSLFALIPAPIFFGYVFDKTCLVWGKTCTGTSNCWMYDSEELRYTLNLITSAFVSIGMFLDLGVWYYVRDVKIFDEEIELKDIAGKEDKT